MLIPLDRKPDWHNPPLITLALVFLNIFIYFSFQYDDNHKQQLAMDYYFGSDLASIELPRYLKYLQNDRREILTRDKQVLFWQLHADGRFTRLLHNGQIIKADEPIYSNWLEQRLYYEKQLENIFSYRYSLKTANPDLLTLLTHMFLHADVYHLLGNMFFLFLFGFVIELSLGRGMYLAAYLVTGLLSGAFDIALNPDSGLWGLGASGAISGLAGIYTVMFGMRKIRFFYTVLFYFDYIRAPALIMLPFWLCYELFQQFMYPQNQVNNLAHIGGLLAGATIAYLAKKYSTVVNIEYLDKEEKSEAFKKDYTLAMRKVASLDFTVAKQMFRELDATHPGNIDIQVQLFNLLKHDPDNEEFHHYTNQILSTDNIRCLPENQLFNIYSDYIKKSPRTMLKAEQLLALAIRFAGNSHIEDAERIMIYLTQRKPEFKRNIEGLSILIKQFHKMKKTQKSRQYLSILKKCYPESSEYKMLLEYISS